MLPKLPGPTEAAKTAGAAGTHPARGFVFSERFSGVSAAFQRAFYRDGSASLTTLQDSNTILD